MAAGTYVPAGAILVVTDTSRELLGARLRGYAGRPFVMAYTPPTDGHRLHSGALRSLVRAPDAVGSGDAGAQWLYVRDHGPADAPARGPV